MILKRKVKRVAPGHHSPEETEARVKAALGRVRDLTATHLATIPSSKPDKPPYKIMMGANNAVWCPCDGFKFRSKCSHMERFRREFKPVVFK